MSDPRSEDFRVSKKSEEHTGELKPNLDTSSTVNEVRRHDKAVGRYDILRDYIAGAISARLAMETLCVKKSRFYKLLKAMQGATTYRVLVSSVTGRRPGLTVTDPETLKLIEEMFEEHYPAHKTIAAVWRHCQAQADNRRMLVGTSGYSGAVNGRRRVGHRPSLLPDQRTRRR